MGLSYTEELVSEYFKHITDDKGLPKYMVSEHVQYQNLQASTQVKGWSDIDVLAIGADEICIIQTKSFAVFKPTVRESINSALDYFTNAEKFVKQRYPIKGKTIRKIFVADYGLSETFRNGLLPAGIETVKLRDVFKDYLNLLNKMYPDYRVGKEENNLTRILIFMLNSFDKELAKGGLLT